MKTSFLLCLILTALAIGSTLTQAEPKKLLVVSITTGYRHDSIPTMNKMLGDLAEKSGAFTVDYILQPEKKDGEPYETTLKNALSKLSPESLSQYDGLVFASTTGDLPIPDKAGLLAWIKSGKAFIGLHSASDTFHGWPGYIDMLGGEFDHHEAQLSVTCLNVDPDHPANKSLGATWLIQQEEVYQLKNYDPSKVHELLVLDHRPDAAHPDPGHYPVSWCKEYGQGRVFYTTLGHRDDIISPDPTIKDRKNPVETSQAYQAHVLGGILWALNLAP